MQMIVIWTGHATVDVNFSWFFHFCFVFFLNEETIGYLEAISLM